MTPANTNHTLEHEQENQTVWNNLPQYWPHLILSGHQGAFVQTSITPTTPTPAVITREVKAKRDEGSWESKDDESE